MVRHVVFFQFTEVVTAEKRPEVMAAIKSSVNNMNGKIPGLLKAEAGENIAGGPHDIVLYCEIDTPENVDVYQNHPLHLAHKELTKDWVCNRVCGDFEVPQAGIESI